MKNLSYFLGFVCMTVACSASTTEIETLRLRVQDSSAELTASEKGVISKFWSTALDEMLITDSSRECVAIRRQLIEQKGRGYLSYYATTYIAEAKSAIEVAFSDAQRMEDDPQLRQMIERNLMILTAELESPGLASLALSRLDAEDDVIRYWAFKAVTNPSLVQQLTSDVTGDEKTTKAILTGLKGRVPVETQTQIQKMAVRFCMAFDDPLARDILLSIADRRIKAYRDWTVSNEILDVSLLGALGHVAVLRPDPDKKVFGYKFAELYALTIQRYLKGKDVLSKEQVGQLLTVIAEVDQNVLGKTMGIKTGILSSLRRKTGLKREYEMLFGDRTRSGQLATQFKFDYGKDASGKSITAPQELGPMPEKLTSRD